MRRRRILRLALVTATMLVGGGASAGAASAADTLWGVDSDRGVTNEFLDEIEKVLGHPDFFGRYLGSLDRAEVDIAFARGTAILLIDHLPTINDALTGYSTGQAAANVAADSASALGAPSGVGIYQDVEQGDNIDTAFIQGWNDQLSARGYAPGFYGNPVNGAFAPAYCGAVASNPSYASTAFWSSVFSPGRTPRASAPPFDPATPPCGADANLWQYGIPSTDAPGSFCAQTQCPHVDTDLALSTAPLWRRDPPKPPKPSCTGVTANVAHGAPTQIQLTCSGESFAYVAPSAPAHGTISNFDAATGRLTYTPVAGYSGPDSFTFTASNDGGTSDAAIASITVLPPKPTCAPISALVATGTPTPIQLTCSGQAISYAAPSTPAHGTLSALDPATGALLYTPAAGYSGPDSFTFTATNAAGSSEPATASVTISTPPRVSNLRARAACIRSVRLNGTPTRGSGALSFSYTLNQAAQVLYELYRRNDSTRHKRCPRNPTGHTQDTFTPQGNLTGPGTPGTNTVVLGRSALAARRPTATTRSHLRQTLRAGRHTVRLAAITNGRTLRPGTYVLLVSATNSLGQRSNLAHTKFFALGNRPPRYVEEARRGRRAVP